MEIPEKEDEEGGGERGGREGEGEGKEELPADTHHFCHNRDIKSVTTKPVGGKEGDDASSLKPIEEAELKERDRRDEGKLKAKAKAKYIPSESFAVEERSTSAYHRKISNLHKETKNTNFTCTCQLLVCPTNVEHEIVNKINDTIQFADLHRVAIQVLCEKRIKLSIDDPTTFTWNRKNIN
ncbi:hypothetical protein V1478_018373 [Vespula squamosa]|uniref:Uncharacterized protein n=1 Tax=Vespula squamosa TaxID=30214 RepID=A0ABD1ZUU9_VESSQ